jgi:hypothetical protein
MRIEVGWRRLGLRPRGLSGWAIGTISWCAGCQLVIDIERYEFSPGGGASGDDAGVPPTPQASGPGNFGAAGGPGGGTTVALTDATSAPVPDAPCAGCRIDGACVAEGMRSASSDCEVCDPLRDALAWSNREGNCDDGLFCTTGDRCEERRCTGLPRTCEDGIACNGISACDEASATCTPDINQCAMGQFCDIESGVCATTCDGCLIDDVCVPEDGERTGNPCLVCQPEQSTNAYTAAPGKACGASLGECSGVDTCDAAGVCQDNDLPAGSACGSSAGGICRGADACNGNGQCLPQFSADDTPCEDGSFCTSGDTCQTGDCTSSAASPCPPAQLCNETADLCQCANGGCFIGNSCVAPGALHPENPCLVCDPNRSASDFSAHVGAACGDGTRSQCTEPDTCDGAGVCQPNHIGAGTLCSFESDCSNAASCDGNGNCPFDPKPDGTVCDDGVFCNGADECVQGGCLGGRPRPDCIEP